VPTFDLSSPPVALVSAALLGLGSGILPTGMAEALAVAIGLVEPRGLAVPMWIVFTVSHVAAKIPWYVLGTRGDRMMGPWIARYVIRAREMLRARPSYGTGVLGLSALLSVPPFHLSAIAAGITHLPMGRFVLICLGGRLVRFGVLAAIPGLLRGWWT
jgi:membrane protein YqaA with SNARE-associated domain